ncbi:armadillo repeat-containing protein 7 [Zea mays]|uniref:armadillo repeat-containing protein 7 n=1 Tax=Zea mays TaxID=4577 RepID=UPI0004DEA09F|nr:armadillo repeat-containing protein 7 [Zea mays]|eukprot:XP_008657400.1 armadillo repeat-containing protein 7 [Zea mays]
MEQILLGRSDVAGWGAFIKNPVNKNDYLGEYTGASCPAGRSGTPRDQYLQDLVTQFQNATNEESKEKIVANLANFAYDPFNYAFMRQVVLELFLDCITEPNEKLVEFGIGGICNSCEDPANSLIITQSGGIPLVVQCLWSLVRNTISISEAIVISS